MRSSQLVLSVLLTTGLAGWARADNLAPACTANTLAFYLDDVDSDFPCSVGILNFYNFSFTPSGSSTALDGASDIEVTPDGIGGFAYSQVNGQAFSVLAGTTAQYDIAYNFIIDQGPVATGSDLGMDPPTGNVSIDEFFCADADVSAGIPALQGVPSTPYCSADGTFSPQILHVDDTNPPVSWSTGIVALDPEAYYGGGVLTRIELDGGTSGAGFDQVGQTTLVTDPSAPEPATIVLLLSGLGAMRFRRRFFRMRKPA